MEEMILSHVSLIIFVESWTNSTQPDSYKTPETKLHDEMWIE